MGENKTGDEVKWCESYIKFRMYTTCNGKLWIGIN